MQCGNADIMQPGLLSLQPSIEEILMSEYQFPDFQSQDDGYGMDTMESPTTPMPPSQSRQQQRQQQQQQQQQAQNSQMQSSYSSREYDAAHMLVNYSNQPRQRYSSEPTMSPQPPRQSPSVPPTNPNIATQPLFSVAVQPLFSQAQPLYSQAIYEPVRTTPNPITTRNSYMDAQNTVQNGQPFFERSRQPMTPNTNDYVPQILAAAGISSGATMTSLTSIGPTFSMSTSVAPFQIPNNNLAFRSQPGISNIVSQPQSSQQQWWMNLQTQPSQQIQYQQPERRTFQTLQNVQTSPLQSPDASSSNPPSFRQQIPQPQGLVPSQLLLQQPQQPQKIATKDAQYQYSPSLNLSQYLTPQSAQQIQSSLTNILTNNSSPFYSPSASTSTPLDEARQMPPPKLPRHNQPQVAAVKNPSDLYNRPLISIATSGSISPPTTLDARPNIPNSMLLSPTESFSAPKPLSSAPVPQRRSSLTTALTTPLQETIATQEYAKRSPPPQLETTPISPEQPSGSSVLLDMPIKSESPFSGATMMEPKKLIPSGSKRRSSKSVPADSTLHPEERKRILHLHAEKNRRCALKDGFDQLLNAIPAIDEAGIKATNAVVLNHAATYIRGLKDEQEERNQEIDAMKEKINGINAKIALLQSNLPSNRRASTSTTPSMTNQIEQFSERYTKDRSRRDYRFWLMSQMMRPLVQSFAAEIHQDQHSPERVLSSAREWLNRHWNAAELRPLASEMLLYLATETGALTNPNALSEHIIKEINKPS
uniref:BHLH domain-containing protein n=1 Tax=Acrobeloides nanus TaxID=290746 RepID=A0A914E8R1_9BILA